MMGWQVLTDLFADGAGLREQESVRDCCGLFDQSLAQHRCIAMLVQYGPRKL
jgi:hypothetical protein